MRPLATTTSPSWKPVERRTSPASARSGRRATLSANATSTPRSTRSSRTGVAPWQPPAPVRSDVVRSVMYVVSDETPSPSPGPGNGSTTRLWLQPSAPLARCWAWPGSASRASSSKSISRRPCPGSATASVSTYVPPAAGGVARRSWRPVRSSGYRRRGSASRALWLRSSQVLDELDAVLFGERLEEEATNVLGVDACGAHGGVLPDSGEADAAASAVLASALLITRPVASMRSTRRVAPPVESTRSWPMERIGSPSWPARPRIISTSKVRWLMPQSSSRALPSRYSSRLAAPCRCPKASTSLSFAASRAVVISDSALLRRAHGSPPS